MENLPFVIWMVGSSAVNGWQWRNMDWGDSSEACKGFCAIVNLATYVYVGWLLYHPIGK